MNKCRLIDEFLLDTDPNAEYRFCKDCPYFWECMEENNENKEKE